VAVFLITGGAGGIGAALAGQLAAQGDEPVVSDVDLARAQDVGAAIDGATALELDVADPDACNRAVQEIVARHGRIDGLACCAGILRDFDVGAVDVSRDGFEHVLRVNLHGSFFVCQAVARAMIAAGHGGSIALVSSGMAQRGMGSPAYSASKGAIESLTRVLAREWADHGIRVNAVAPGMIDTEMSRAARENPEFADWYAAHTTLGRSGRPEELAAALSFLLSDAASYMSGAIVPVDGGFLVV
jgi:NAD(P)-dependent dehydrogenase (short-subunit alcohol dehydrogenase family)